MARIIPILISSNIYNTAQLTPTIESNAGKMYMVLCLPSLIISLDHCLAPSVLQAIGFTSALQGWQIELVQRANLWHNSKTISATHYIC